MTKFCGSLAGKALAAVFLTGTVAATSSQVSAQTPPYIGETRLFGFDWCPVGWIPAEGQLLAISSNDALFSLYGTIYGGDGRRTFALPDLRGRTPIGFGQGSGLPSYTIGAKGGAEQINLLPANLNHTHGASTSGTLNATSADANTGTPSNTVALAKTSFNAYGPGTVNTDFRSEALSADTIVSDTGGDRPIGLRGPVLTMKWCVATVGVIPPRN